VFEYPAFTSNATGNRVASLPKLCHFGQAKKIGADTSLHLNFGSFSFRNSHRLQTDLPQNRQRLKMKDSNIIGSRNNEKIGLDPTINSRFSFKSGWKVLFRWHEVDDTLKTIWYKGEGKILFKKQMVDGKLPYSPICCNFSNFGGQVVWTTNGKVVQSIVCKGKYADHSTLEDGDVTLEEMVEGIELNRFGNDVFERLEDMEKQAKMERHRGSLTCCADMPRRESKVVDHVQEAFWKKQEEEWEKQDALEAKESSNNNNSLTDSPLDEEGEFLDKDFSQDIVPRNFWCAVQDGGNFEGELENVDEGLGTDDDGEVTDDDSEEMVDDSFFSPPKFTIDKATNPASCGSIEKFRAVARSPEGWWKIGDNDENKNKAN
jgi:hypothetical protein